MGAREPKKPHLLHYVRIRSSQGTTAMFGYSKIELENANVAMLMPQPFSQRHPSYLTRYVSTGEPHILDRVQEVVALHKVRTGRCCR